MLLHALYTPFAIKIFMMETARVVTSRTRRRVWQAGEFPVGPSRRQLREVRLCLSHFARQETAPYILRGNNGNNTARFVDFVNEDDQQYFNFVMLYGVTVVIRMRFVKTDFIRRYCNRNLFPAQRDRRALPIPYV